MDEKTINRVLTILEKEVQNYKVPVMDLHETHKDEPYRVLIGTILSSQTKDQVTAAACKRLFSKVKSFADIRKTSEESIKDLIKPVSFYPTKAKHLKELAHIMKEEYNDVIPQTIEKLVTLPGVGRKTANLTLIIAFKKHGICVDTHVHRIFNRFGYIKTKNPFETEMMLREKLPKKWWKTSNRILVAYGQGTCGAVSPKCSICPVVKYCEQKGVTTKR